jgi:hypothetical protein
MDKDGLQSHGQLGDSVNPPPLRRPRLLAARLALVKLVLVWFLLFWPPRYDFPAAAGQASRPLSAVGPEEKEFTLKDDGAGQRGRQDGSVRQSRRRHRGRGRLVHSLIRVCAVSTIIALLAIVIPIAIWHPGGWSPL